MKLILAPMAAISHSALRMLIADFYEPSEYFTEMIHAPSAISGGNFEKWYFRVNPSPDKLVWQITSPEYFSAVKAVPLLLNYGGFGIDLNMGCCAPQIVRTGAGFAWMQKPLPEVASFVRSVKKAILKYEPSCQQNENSFVQNKQKQIRLSVKLRLGETDDYSCLLKFSKMLVDEGVDLITLHPRTQKQKLSRPCKYEPIARLAEDLSIPVYGNGDIDSFKKFKEVSVKYPCAGWMIGRAAVQKPWIFKEINSEGKDIKVDLLKTANKFIQYLKEEQPPDFYMTRACRFFSYFCDNFKFAHFIKSKVLNSATLDEMQKKIAEYFVE